MSSSRAAATKTAIEDAALDLALARGYDQVTVDMICEQVGVTQRTFFNHFPTKDDALLGRDLPQIDERAARQFIIARGSVLIDAVSLITMPVEGRTHHRMSERWKVIAATPTLLSKQMERLEALDGELNEIIMLRLRNQEPERSEQELTDEAAMTNHMLNGVFRWIGSRAELVGHSPEAFEEIAGNAQGILREVLLNSAPTE